MFQKLMQLTYFKNKLKNSGRKKTKLLQNKTQQNYCLRIDYSKAVNALAVRAFALSAAFLRASASLRARNSVFIPGAAIRQTPNPKIAPPDRENHNGMPRITEFAYPTANPIERPIPRGFSAIFNRVALP